MMKLNIQLFGHTNETTNYDLPQFVGTDKPTWLGDFNSAMSAIDTAIAGNASDITSLGTRVTSAEGTASQASSDVSSLSSTVSSLSSDVSSISTTATNASQTATSALNTANTADGKADTNASAIATTNSNLSGVSSRVTALEPVVLYTNPDSQVHTSISLADSSANYEYLQVYYSYNGENFGYCEIPNANGKHIDMSCHLTGSSGTTYYMYVTAANYTISGSTISKMFEERWRFGTSGSPTRTADPGVMRIDKVLGVKFAGTNFGS